MIYEFLVDPNIFNDIKNFGCLLQEFSFSRARVILEFPKKWCKLVYEQAECLSTMEKKHLEVWLHERKKFLVNSNLPYDMKKNWITNASIVTISSNLNIISTLENTKNVKITNLLKTPDDIYVKNNKWYCPSEIQILCNQAEFKKILSPVLKHAHKSIFIIDPYFSQKKRYVETFKIINDAIIKKDIDVKIFTNINDKFLNGLCKLKIFILKDKFHNRYIITDKCGIKFPYGLDIKNKYDEINLMNDNVFNSIFEKFNDINENDILDIIYL